MHQAIRVSSSTPEFRVAPLRRPHRITTFARCTATGTSLKGVEKSMIAGYLSAPLALFDYRVKLYNDLTPPAPVADANASSFFVRSAVWSAETPAQQAQVINLELQLLKSASKQNAAALRQL